MMFKNKFFSLCIFALILLISFILIMTALSPFIVELKNKYNVTKSLDHKNYILAQEYYNYNQLSYKDYVSLGISEGYYTASFAYGDVTDSLRINIIFMMNDEFQRLFGNRKHNVAYIGENAFKEYSKRNILYDIYNVDIGFNNGKFIIDDKQFNIVKLPIVDFEFINYQSGYIEDELEIIKRRYIDPRIFGMLLLENSIILPIEYVNLMEKLEPIDYTAAFSRIVLQDDKEADNIIRKLESIHPNVIYRCSNPINELNDAVFYSFKKGLLYLVISLMLIVIFLIISRKIDKIIAISIVIISGTLGIFYRIAYPMRDWLGERMEKSVPVAIGTVVISILVLAILRISKINNHDEIT